MTELGARTHRRRERYRDRVVRKDMAVFVALLRAINVGSGRAVKMTDLARVVGEAGGEQVSTYIQSGNVVFAHETLAAGAGG